MIYVVQDVKQWPLTHAHFPNCIKLCSKVALDSFRTVMEQNGNRGRHNIKLTFLPFLLPASTWSHSPVVAGMSHHSCMEGSVSLCGFWWSHRSRATLQLLSCTQSPAPWARWALPRSTTSDRCHLCCWSACCWQGRTCYWKGYRETQRTALSPGRKKKQWQLLLLWLLKLIIMLIYCAFEFILLSSIFYLILWGFT